ncbi:MAG: hypothetical protein HN846_01250 [Candidatus Pacebacteria bacterium]|jgi:hypothetical protein|nr:hypothetical protein [Candidatus Paceibacterota bacterium]MBT3511831.1 hypothetical protein [Candidatus Paceibacterota bacterium]MBT4004623.1 hypothetical protein [Candidatus Paceibacterota bacterium]MBT4358351.1 hypothetical protein [Candidatus Paceibacterota bacterium]MBT4681399.1 hypothetical protein [Candidatus Paceibacterota bacterium]
MNDPAQLMSRLRSSFSTQPKPSLKPVASVNTTQGQLDVLDKVLTEVEQTSIEAIAQAVPQVTLDVTDTLNPAQPTTASLKESIASVAPDISPIESGAGLQQVEYETSGELPVEVESYLQKVEKHQDQKLSEVVIADGTATPSVSHPPVKKPVIVLPITIEEEKAGQKKSLHLSIRWLVEWSKKIMKMFAGEVIYKEAE